MKNTVIKFRAHCFKEAYVIAKLFLLTIFLLAPVYSGKAIAATTCPPAPAIACRNTSGAGSSSGGSTASSSCNNPKSTADIATTCESSLGNNCDKNDTASACLQKNSAFTKDLQLIVNVLSAGVGIVVTGMIIVGGIQYTMAGGNPTIAAAARKRITNALIALVAFMFTWAFLQWLIPGGVFT